MPETTAAARERADGTVMGLLQLRPMLLGFSALMIATARGELHPGRDHRVEAARLLTLSHGLGASVLVGQRSTDDARAVLAYHLDRLFLSAAAGNVD